MKTWGELQSRLRQELEQWFVKQCRDNYTDFHLYYLPTTPEHNGGILIAAEAPGNPEYKLAMPEAIMKGCTIEQNFNRLSQGVLRRLPVLTE